MKKASPTTAPKLMKRFRLFSLSIFIQKLSKNSENMRRLQFQDGRSEKSCEDVASSCNTIEQLQASRSEGLSQRRMDDN